MGPSGVAGSSLWVSQLVSPDPYPNPTPHMHTPPSTGSLISADGPRPQVAPSRSHLFWSREFLFCLLLQESTGRIRWEIQSTWKVPCQICPLFLKWQRLLSCWDSWPLSPRGALPALTLCRCCLTNPASAFLSLVPFTCIGLSSPTYFFLLYYHPMELEVRFHLEN